MATRARRAPRVPARNAEVAAMFREAAELLDRRGEPFRAAAYGRAADAVEQLGEDVARVLDRGGVPALARVQDLGRATAAAIEEYVLSGRWSHLERLRTSDDPVALLRTVPGVGDELARRLRGAGIDTLEALERAAHDGRLARVPGFGARRVAGVRAALAGMLARPRRRATVATTRARGAEAAEPDVATLLEVDREYRERAAAGELRTIAPRRFNPRGERWLPVMTARRGAWRFRALFSNTSQAHALGRTRDWVVVYFTREGDAAEGQRTVVTASRGPFAGRRVVRGREAETPPVRRRPRAPAAAATASRRRAA